MPHYQPPPPKERIAGCLAPPEPMEVLRLGLDGGILRVPVLAILLIEYTYAISGRQFIAAEGVTNWSLWRRVRMDRDHPEPMYSRVSHLPDDGSEYDLGVIRRTEHVTPEWAEMGEEQWALIKQRAERKEKARASSRRSAAKRKAKLAALPPIVDRSVPIDSSVPAEAVRGM
tara:strand:- start:134 stop:649 length:516 start_codon:yes stop_codon:yes gene_type:complete